MSLLTDADNKGTDVPDIFVPSSDWPRAVPGDAARSQLFSPVAAWGTRVKRAFLCTFQLDRLQSVPEQPGPWKNPCPPPRCGYTAEA